MLLLEAGGKDNWIWFHIPVGYLFAIGNPRTDWMFRTEAGAGPERPRPGLSPRQGGRRLLRDQRHDLHARPAADYDQWRQLGLTGWSWDDVLPRLQAAGRSFPGRDRTSRRGRRMAGRGAAPALGHSGRRARRRASRWAFRDSTTSTPATMKASAIFTSTRSAAVRWSAARGFLKPALDRPNLRLETSVLSTSSSSRMAAPSACASRRGGQMVEARARARSDPVRRLDRLDRDPATLRHRRSGEWLLALGIAVVRDRPGVGAQSAGSSAAAHDLQGLGRQDPERDLSLAGRARR